MAGVVLLGDKKETAYRLQQVSRHQMILRLYQDILLDMTVCEVEGWDKLEYIRELQDMINHFTKK